MTKSLPASFATLLPSPKKSGRGMVWAKAACRYSPVAVRQKLPSSTVCRRPLPFRTTFVSGAKSQERRRRALFPPQLPSFQDFARNSYGLKILPTNFFAVPMESRFYGVPGGRGSASCQGSVAPLPDRGAIRLSCPLYGTSLLASGSKLVARCLSGWQLAAGSWQLLSDT